MWKKDTSVRTEAESATATASETRIDIGGLLERARRPPVSLTFSYPSQIAYPASGALPKPWDDESIVTFGVNRFQLLSDDGANVQTVTFDDQSVKVSAGVEYLSRLGDSVRHRTNAVAFEFTGSDSEHARFIQCYQPTLFKNGEPVALGDGGAMTFDGGGDNDGCHPAYETSVGYRRYMDDPEPLQNLFQEHFSTVSEPVLVRQEITLTVWVIVRNVTKACLTVTFPYTAESQATEDSAVTIVKGVLTNVTATAKSNDDLVSWLNQDVTGMGNISLAFQGAGSYAAMGLTGLV